MWLFLWRRVKVLLVRKFFQEVAVSEVVSTFITRDELTRSDANAADNERIEVHDGQIITKARPVTFLHLIIIQNLYNLLRAYVREHQLGTVFMDGGRYILQSTPQGLLKARVPDLSFVRTGRITTGFNWDGDFEGAPDFALEVASRGQSSAVLLAKVADYLGAGCEEVWLIYPWRDEVFQFRRDEPAPVRYGHDDRIDTSALFPGLTVTLTELKRTDDL